MNVEKLRYFLRPEKEDGVMMSDTILKKLEVTREKMIQSGLEKGFLNDETIRLSEKLDQLLNLYQFHTTNETKDYDQID